MTTRIVIGARGSDLSRVQALQVGAALQQRDRALRVEYAFSAAVADVPYAGQPDLVPGAPVDMNLGRINGAGGFTIHLHEQLESGRIDLAVHSWKDLPLPERARTGVIATLPRADARDVLVVRAAAVDRLRRGAFAEEPFRVLSCSARRRVNLDPFLRWALPGPVAQPLFVPVRGDIERRLRALLEGDEHALVVAKAALDRLLDAPLPRFAAVRARIRALLAACRVMIVPLVVNPAAPGQGALAIESLRGRADLAARLAEVNDARSFELVARERAQLARLGDDETPIGISALDLPFGEVEFLRGDGADGPVERVTLTRRGAPLPRPRSSAAVWVGDAEGADPFERVAVPGLVTPPARVGLLVARAEALPSHWTPADTQVVWSAGLATWRRLAARGVWVSGSDESLGETGARAAHLLFPDVKRWLKLTHAEGYDPPIGERVATYRLEEVRAPLPVLDCTHFFWRSGSQFMAYLRAFPGLERAWHGCGPGNTLRQLRDLLPAGRVQPFLSAGQFRAELAA